MEATKSSKKLKYYSKSPFGTPVYYLTDAIGTTIGLVDGAGTEVGDFRYDSFRNLMRSSGMATNAVGSEGDEKKIVELIAAIQSGDYLKVQNLVKAGVDVNKCPPGLGATPPLADAVAYGHVEIVKTLLSAGAYPHGYILLQLESNSEEKIFQLLSLLIDVGIDLNFKLEEADTVVMKAAGRGELSVVKLLVEAGADVNQTNQDGESPLIYAAYGGWQEVYEYLEPLTCAELRTEAEEQLKQGLLRRQRKNDKLLDEFMSAAMWGTLDTVLDTIKKGVDINAIGVEGCCALFYASTRCYLTLVCALIEAGADVNLGTEGGGKTPLMASAGNISYVGHVERSEAKTHQVNVIRVLIKAGADVNAQTIIGWTALMEAASVGNLPAVHILLEAGADVNAQTLDGETALMRAASVDNPLVVKLLLEARADINAQTVSGVTALMSAAYDGRAEGVKLLLEAGADVNTQDHDGLTALMEAVTPTGESKVVKILLQAKANVNAQSNKGFTALMRAASYGRVKDVQLLVEAGADIKIRDENGKTALDYAVDASKKIYYHTTTDFRYDETIQFLRQLEMRECSD